MGDLCSLTVSARPPPKQWWDVHWRHYYRVAIIKGYHQLQIHCLRFTDIHISVHDWETMPTSGQAMFGEPTPLSDNFDAEHIVTDLHSVLGIIRELNTAQNRPRNTFSTHSPRTSGIVGTDSLLNRVESDERLGVIRIDIDEWAANQTQAPLSAFRVQPQSRGDFRDPSLSILSAVSNG